MFGFLSSVFGTNKKGDKAPGAGVQHRESYNGYCIEVVPQREDGQYRIGARIYRKDNPGQVHQLIRADAFPSLDIATQQSLVKARQAIDQLGERLFTQGG